MIFWLSAQIDLIPQLSALAWKYFFLPSVFSWQLDTTKSKTKDKAWKLILASRWISTECFFKLFYAWRSASKYAFFRCEIGSVLMCLLPALDPHCNAFRLDKHPAFMVFAEGSVTGEIGPGTFAVSTLHQLPHAARRFSWWLLNRLTNEALKRVQVLTYSRHTTWYSILQSSFLWCNLRGTSLSKCHLRKKWRGVLFCLQTLLYLWCASRSQKNIVSNLSLTDEWKKRFRWDANHLLQLQVCFPLVSCFIRIHSVILANFSWLRNCQTVVLILPDTLMRVSSNCSTNSLSSSSMIVTFMYPVATPLPRVRVPSAGR